MDHQLGRIALQVTKRGLVYLHLSHFFEVSNEGVPLLRAVLQLVSLARDSPYKVHDCLLVTVEKYLGGVMSEDYFCGGDRTFAVPIELFNCALVLVQLVDG